MAKVAPFLTLDGDVYPVVSGGRLDWVVDAYTTTDLYPYSERGSLDGATADSVGTPPPVEQAGDQVNYIRNSVKAVVDAYTGAVTLYQWNSSDPVLRTWMKAFPGIIKPRNAIPPVCWRTCATRRTCSRCSGRSSARPPRPARASLLRRPGLLGRPRRPDDRPGRIAAALLPHGNDAGPTRSRLLAHDVAGVQGAAEPGGVHGGGQQPA